MSSGGGFFDPRWFQPGWCNIHRTVCGETLPDRKWREFCAAVKGKTVWEGYKCVPRFRSCRFRTAAADFLIEQRAIMSIRSYGEGKRLLRQILATPNDLSRLFPLELLEPIAKAITSALRPNFLASLERGWKSLVVRPAILVEVLALLGLGYNDHLVSTARERRMKRLAQSATRDFGTNRNLYWRRPASTTPQRP